jgi:hypothetical protein
MAAGGGVFYVEEGAGGGVVAVAWVSGCGGVALWWVGIRRGRIDGDDGDRV